MEIYALLPIIILLIWGIKLIRIDLNRLEKENQALRLHNKSLNKMNDELLEERYEELKTIRTNKKQ